MGHTRDHAPSFTFITTLTLAPSPLTFHPHLSLSLSLTPRPPNLTSPPCPRSGEITKKEFRTAMTRMGLDLPKQDVDGLFDSWDPSGGGEQHLVSK